MKTLASIIAIACLAVACGAQAPGSPDGGTAEALGTTEQASCSGCGCTYPAPPGVEGASKITAQNTVCGWGNQITESWGNCPGEVFGTVQAASTIVGSPLCTQTDACHITCSNDAFTWYYNWMGDGSDPVQEWSYTQYFPLINNCYIGGRVTKLHLIPYSINRVTHQVVCGT